MATKNKRISCRNSSESRFSSEPMPENLIGKRKREDSARLDTENRENIGN